MLPDSLWSLVYEFENTKCEKFVAVMKEFEAVNKFWYLHFLSQPTMTSNKMRMTHGEIVGLNTYWNTTFLTRSYMTRNTKESWEQKGTVCVPAHIVDTDGWVPLWQSLKRNIQSYQIMLRRE